MITLRLVDELDRDRLLSWRNLPEIRKWMLTNQEIGQEEHDRWFNGLLTGTSRRQWIVLEDERPIGSAYLTDLIPGGDCCNLGIYIAERSVRGSGAGVACMQLILDEAFSMPGMQCVGADVLAGNRKAIRLYERAGMCRVNGLLGHGPRDDLWRFEIAKSQWLTANLGNEG